MDIFADRLKKALDYRNKHPVDLYTNTRLDKSTISHFLSGKRHPKRQTIQIIADYLEVSPLYLMGFTDDMVLRTERLHQHIYETDEDREYHSLMNEINSLCSTFDNDELKQIVKLIKALKK